MAFACGCNDTAVVLRLVSDETGPAALDSICVGVDADGLQRFGRQYDVSAAPMAHPLPQTLTVLASGRAAMQAIAYGEVRGQEVARARRQVLFTGGKIARVDLPLDRCAPEPLSGMWRASGPPLSGAFDRAILEPGPAGNSPLADQALAAGAGLVSRQLADGAGLHPLADGAPPAPTGAVTQLLSVDVDGNCAKDLVVLASGQPPSLWLRAPDHTFTAPPGLLPALAPMSGAAAGDVDGDGQIDLVLVGGNQAHLLLGDGAGHFRETPSAFDVPPAGATAVALGDLDGDGHLDVVIAADTQPMGGITAVWLNDAQGSGHFTRAPGALPPLPQHAVALALADFDGDGHLDLAIGNLSGPVRLYLNRGDAFLEDRSFDSLPDQTSGDVPTLLAVDLNGDCEPDLVVPRAGGPPLIWLGSGGGHLVSAPAPELPMGFVASGAVSDDVNGDGRADLVFFGPSGLALDLQQ
ncbi:MAG TPA: VCBS repeat-containing protein [Polyangia bacterium]